MCPIINNTITKTVFSVAGAIMRTEGLVRDLSMKDLVSDAGGMLVGATEFVGGV